MKSMHRFTIISLYLLFIITSTNAQYSNLTILEEGTDQDFEFIEDINNDGILDAVLNGKFECGGDEYLRIYHGRIDDISGAYSFELVHTNFLDHGFFFYLMDLNGDGHKAVVSQQTSNGNITISRYENGVYKDYLLEDPDIDLTFIDDIDNDGIDENIRRQFDTFYRGNFDEDLNYVETVYLTKDVQSLSLYDYDGDGIMDYLYFEDDNLHILLIDGGLKEEILIPDGDIPFVFADERLFFDIDQNGDVDYLYRPSSANGLGPLYVAWNIGQNGFEEVEQIAMTIALENFKTFKYLDLDFDGRVELVIKDYSEPGTYTCRDVKTGNEVLFSYEEEFDEFKHFATQGTSQIVLASDYQYEVQEPLAIIEYKLESDVYVGREIPIVIPGYIRIEDAVRTDLDQDGAIDLLFSAYASAEYGEKTTVRWISDIEGSGQRQSNSILGQLENLDHTIFTDIDADGDTDIVSASDLTIYYNDGLGVFSISKKLELGAQNNSKLTHADVNDDGLADLLFLNRDGDLNFYKNIDGQTFEVVKIEAYDANSEISFQHIDKDDNIDIVIMRQSTIYTIINDGEGNFTNTYNSNTSGASLLTFDDIDQDGDVEYIYAHFSEVGYFDFSEAYTLDLSSNVVLFEGENFQEYHSFDVDKDGDMDFLTKESTNDQINWYEFINADSVVSRGLLSSFLVMPDEPYFFNSPYLQEDDQFVIGDCGKLYFTQPEVESINICVFADSNDDNVLDSEDYALVFYPLSISADGINSVLTTDASGCINVNLHAETYNIQSVEGGCFGIDQLLEVNAQNTDTFNLLATEDGGEERVDIDLTSAPNRCGFTVEHWLTIRNELCDSELGTIEVELDDISLWNTISTEESFSQFEKYLTFDMTDLRPGESKTIKWSMEIPDFSFTGEFLDHHIKVLDINSNELAEHKYSSEIRCAYDPNDKSITPDRTSEFEESYVTDEILTYLIRFQNVGNDTAFNVVVRDTLSDHLDISALQNIRTSHQCYFTIDSTSRILEFYFDDIRLVDSLTNEEGSHGFVKFDIGLVENLEDFVPIYNSAGIYFDFNPPVITNTVEAKYVHDFSILTSTNNIEFSNEIIVHPNPASHFIEISGLPSDLVTLTLFSISGQRVLVDMIQKSENYMVDVSSLESGLYLLQVDNEKKSEIIKIVIQ